MPYDQYLITRIMGAVRARDFSKVEELWIDIQSSHKPLLELDAFYSIAREVAERGDKERAAELLLMLRDDLKGEGRDDELFALLRAAVGYSGRVKGVREELINQYRRVYGEHSGFEAVLSKTDLAGEGKVHKCVEELDQAFAYVAGDFVFHSRGWGIGKVVEAHPDQGEFVIDFARRRGQRMDAGMALRALEKRSTDDLDVLLWTDKDRVRDLAATDPLRLLKSALGSSNGKLQARDLREKLTDILNKSAWTKFWAKARKLAKDDPQIEVGPAPKSIISLREQPLEREDEVAENLRRAPRYKDRIATARKELLAVKKDSSGQPPQWLAEALKLLRKNSEKGQYERAAADLESMLFFDEAAAAFPGSVPDFEPSSRDGGVDPETGEPLPGGVSPQISEFLDDYGPEQLPDLLRAVTIPEYRKQVVALLPRIQPEDYAVTLRALLLDPAPQTWRASIKVLKAAGQDDVILDAINQIVIKPSGSPAAYAAFARARLNQQLDVLEDRRDVDLLGKAIQLLDTINLEYKDSGDRKRKARLKATVDALRAIFNDKGNKVLDRVIGEASEDEVRRILTLVRQSPALTATVRRNTERFVVRRFPEMLAAYKKADGEEGEGVLFCTAEGKLRQERELARIMEEDFEAIRIEIGKALEFGDISENAELDAAREKQQRLADRIERTQDELSRAVVIDFEKVATDIVSIGSRVSVTNLSTKEEESFTILGPWDLDDAQPSIISHLSAVATGLIGTRPESNATVTLPDGSKVEYLVNTIERAALTQDK
jgi:transcription elongation GreA/GreB family factor